MHRQDKQLVRSVLAREDGAFDAFFETYFSRLYRFCRSRMGDEAAVEDVVQEALIKALQKLHQYRGEASLFSWLCQICRNEMSNWYARNHPTRQRQSAFDDDPQVQAALISLAHEASESEAAQRELSQLVQLALDYLPDRYGKALEWKYLEGRSVAEIGERLKLGQLATQSLLARARNAFRRAYLELQQELPASTS